MRRFEEKVLSALPAFPKARTLPVLALGLKLVDENLKINTEEFSLALEAAEKEILKAINTLSFAYPVLEMTLPVQKATKRASAKYGIQREGVITYYSLASEPSIKGVAK